VKKNDTVEKRKPLNALTQINVSVQSILGIRDSTGVFDLQPQILRKPGFLGSAGHGNTQISSFIGQDIFVFPPPVWGSWSNREPSQMAAMAEQSGSQERLLVLNFHFPPDASSKSTSKKDKMIQSSFLHHYFIQLISELLYFSCIYFAVT